MRRLFVILSLALLFVCAGCSMNGDSTQRINDVLNSHTMTPAQKNAAVAKIKAQDASPLSAPWLPSAIIVGVGLIILVIAVMARGSRVPAETPEALPIADNAGASVNAGPLEQAEATSVMTPAERLAMARGQAPNFGDPLAQQADSAQVEEVAEPVATLPMTQAEVDAIPRPKRSISFFTSRPLSSDDLVQVAIVIGGQVRSVNTTPKEAENIEEGNVPKVRAFEVDGRTLPWYKCDAYDPYTSFWDVVSNHDEDADVETSWIALGQLEPNIEAYTNRIAALQAEPEPTPEDAVAADEAAAEPIEAAAPDDEIADDESVAEPAEESVPDAKDPRKQTAKIQARPPE